jgi:hypothetical protein
MQTINSVRDLDTLRLLGLSLDIGGKGVESKADDTVAVSRIHARAV